MHALILLLLLSACSPPPAYVDDTERYAVTRFTWWNGKAVPSCAWEKEKAPCGA